MAINVRNIYPMNSGKGFNVVQFHETSDWLSLDQLPQFAHLVNDLLADTERMHRLFWEARLKPWAFGDATVRRTIRLYNQRLEYLEMDREQLARWSKETLTPSQQQDIETLSKQTARNRELMQEILVLANEIKRNTIDQILARDGPELALDVLTGKFKPPI
jgi:hypothetical protein